MPALTGGGLLLPLKNSQRPTRGLLPEGPLRLAQLRSGDLVVHGVHPQLLFGIATDCHYDPASESIFCSYP
jgi:hypothetical protein